MSTTTIRIDDELKARLAAVAERSGTTAHAFIVDALAESVEQAEVEQSFAQLAEQRWTQVQASDVTVPWADAKGYLEARLRGERPRRPAVRSGALSAETPARSKAGRKSVGRKSVGPK